jgi:hypothetical protein
LFLHFTALIVLEFFSHSSFLHVSNRNAVMGSSVAARRAG